jgi:hypothetical protein
VEAATAYGLDSLRDGRGMAVSDFDGDGGLDIIVNNYNAPAHYFVNRAQRGHWLRVRLRGSRSNRDGIGAILRARTGELRQMRVVCAGEGYASQNSRVAHFGLGTSPVLDELVIEWSSGTRQTLRNIAVDRVIEVEEDAGAPAPVGRNR